MPSWVICALVRRVRLLSVRVRRPVRRGCPGDDQSRFVGEHDGLDTIPQAELGEYPADMDLHGAPGQVQAGRDLAVGHACRDQGEGVLFAPGENVLYLGGAAAVRRLGRLGGELADEAPGRGRREDGVTRGDGVDRGDQPLGLGVFEQEAAGARPEPA